MIYFDAVYIAKCYLNEAGADRVRDVAYRSDGLASCELARLEFAAILKRHGRERHLTRREMTAIDALHLACAEEHGFDEVYTNDRHMLEAARYFHVTGVNVLA